MYLQYNYIKKNPLGAHLVDLSWWRCGESDPGLVQVQTMLGHMLMLVLVSLGADRAITPK